ncbi:MAG: hypothetical protein IJ318_00120 [Clostridia bacterium]|nr:hypothetical protein [Clostridia bacterium]
MKISPKKFILISTIIALDIADGKTASEINAYKNLFNAIACNLQNYCNQLTHYEKNN